MAFRPPICVCGLCLCLLLTVALANGPSRSPQAVIVAARDDCYKTATGVPGWCAREFLKALFNGPVADYPISNYCCGLLACVREWTCDHVLRGFCPEANRCPPVDTRHDDYH